MTEKPPIRALIEAVEAGNDNSELWQTALGSRHGYAAMRALHGSLDAALALHEALLPGHWYKLCSWPYLTDRVAQVGEHYGRADTIARAWLLAILKAYEAQQ